MKQILLLFILLFLFVFIPKTAMAASTYSVGNSSNYNIRIDGALAGEQFGSIEPHAIDLNGDGRKDLLVGSWASGNTRSGSGSLWVIYNPLLERLTGSGNNIDLADPSNYSLRFDGAAVGDALTFGEWHVADVNGNGKQDLLITAPLADNNGANSGSLYVIYDSVLGSYTGTGNNIDLATSTNYNLRYDGAAGSDFLGIAEGIITMDLDADGKRDILVAARAADSTNGTDAGSLYIIYNTLIDDYTGTGNNIDLSVSSNYNLRYDGGTATEFFSSGIGSLSQGDIDNDGKEDLIVGAYARNTTENDSGALYVIYNTLIDDYAGTGNVIDLANTANFNIRYDGSERHGFLGVYYGVADIDNDNKNDIIISAYESDNNLVNGNGKGWVFVMFNTLIDDFTGTGNVVVTSSSTSYNLRFTGTPIGHNLGISMFVEDFNMDERADLILTAESPEDVGTADSSGVVYIIYSSSLDQYSGTGNTINISDSNAYNVRYDGINANDSFGSSFIGDLNGDGRNDFLAGAGSADNNSRDGSGSVWIIYNFKHFVSSHSSIGRGTSGGVVEGKVTVTESLTNLSGVEWSLSNSPQGTWTKCQLLGSDNPIEENFKCLVAGIGNNDTVYVRAYDKNVAYTTRFGYAQIPVGSRIKERSTPDFMKNNGGLAKTNDVSVMVQNGIIPFDVNFNADLVPGIKAPESINGYHQISNTKNIWYTSSFNKARVLEDLSWPSTLIFNYSPEDLITYRSSSPFAERNIKIAYSADEGNTWRILPSFVNTDHKSVSTVTKPTGYYMVVAR